jgi:hypothetical protein
MIADLVAEAVETRLNTQGWSEPFVARRVEVVVPIAPEDTALRVLVLDFAVVTGRGARQILREEVVVDVAVQQRVGEDTVRVRQLKGLVEEFSRHFALAEIGYPFAAAEYLAHRVPDHLREDRVFTAVVRLTYRTHHHGP